MPGIAHCAMYTTSWTAKQGEQRSAGKNSTKQRASIVTIWHYGFSYLKHEILLIFCKFSKRCDVNFYSSLWSYFPGLKNTKRHLGHYAEVETGTKILQRINKDNFIK